MASTLIASDFGDLVRIGHAIVVAVALFFAWGVIWLLAVLYRRRKKSPEARQSSTRTLSVIAAFLVLVVCFALYVAHPMVTLLSVGAIVLLIHVAFEATQPRAYSVRDMFVMMTVVAIALGAIAFVVRR